MNPRNSASAAFGRSMGVVSQLYETRMATLLEPFDLTVAQFGILNHLANAKAPQRISDIAASVEVLQPAVTKVLTKFEERGLVSTKQSPTDKRSKFVEATPDLFSLIRDIYARLGPDFGRSLALFSDEELDVFVELLKRYGAWLDENRL